MRHSATHSAQVRQSEEAYLVCVQASGNKQGGEGRWPTSSSASSMKNALPPPASSPFFFFLFACTHISHGESK
jgi:hypothetical protein